MKEYQYLFNSKNYENLPHCRKFIRAYFAKSFNLLSHSDFSGEIFATAVNFCLETATCRLVKISIVKAINATFIEIKAAKHWSK